MPERTARFSDGSFVTIRQEPGDGLPGARETLVRDWLQALLDWKQIPVQVRACENSVQLDPVPDSFQTLLDQSLETLLFTPDMQVLRLKQAAVHKPQDRAVTGDFPPFSRLVVTTPQGYATAWVNPATGTETAQTGQILLANRVIRELFGREWLEGNEQTPGLDQAPVLVRLDASPDYLLGLPKADQIDRVLLSSTLHDSLTKEAEHFSFYLYNPLTDTRMYFPFEGSDYEDHGRVRYQGQPARKVMMPRYYRILMGYQDLPVRRIRKEAFVDLLESAGLEERQLLTDSYHPVQREIFYDLDTENLTEEVRQQLAQIERHAGSAGRIQILRRPKEALKEPRLHRLWNRILKQMVGSSRFELKVTWTIDTDDRNNVARLNPDMMNLMGVGENDKILVTFGHRQVSLRVLASETMELYQVGIPAPARLKLGLNSVNDIVSVERNMNHILSKYSQVQAMTILGTLLAVSEFLPGFWLPLGVSVVFAPLLIYFVLREERGKVR